jgi:hypothetical protein
MSAATIVVANINFRKVGVVVTLIQKMLRHRNRPIAGLQCHTFLTPIGLIAT